MAEGFPREHKDNRLRFPVYTRPLDSRRPSPPRGGGWVGAKCIAPGCKSMRLVLSSGRLVRSNQ